MRTCSLRATLRRLGALATSSGIGTFSVLQGSGVCSSSKFGSSRLLIVVLEQRRRRNQWGPQPHGNLPPSSTMNPFCELAGRGGNRQERRRPGTRDNGASIDLQQTVCRQSCTSYLLWVQSFLASRRCRRSGRSNRKEDAVDPVVCWTSSVRGECSTASRVRGERVHCCVW